MAVDYFHLFRVRMHHNILIIVLYLLQFRSWTAVSKDDTVAAEDSVRRTVIPVPAVSNRFPAKAVFPDQSLVNKIPDESALIQFLFISQFRIFVHGAVRVAHGMGILAQDERLITVVFQVTADFFRRGIHFCFNIGYLPQPQCGINIIDLMISLIMHRTGWIKPFHLPAHLQDDRTCQAFIPAGPDQYTGMVPVPAHHGTDPVQQQGLPCRLRSREHLVLADITLPQHIPHPMAFHIVLINHIESQFVAEPVKRAGIWIMTGTDRVDIIPLHQQQIPADFLLRNSPAGFAAEIMTVHTLKDYPDPVHPDHAVPDFNLPETDPLAGRFFSTVRCRQRHLQVIQIRVFRGPETWMIHCQDTGNLRRTCNGFFPFGFCLFPVLQANGYTRIRRGIRLHLPAHSTLGESFVRFRGKLQVPYMDR